MTAATPDTEPDLLALDQQVCFALAVAARSVIALYRPVLEPLGLTHPQYLVMLALWQHRRLTVKELGGLLQLDSGTLSPLLKRLVSVGLVTKARDGRDERVVVVELTETGSALRQQALAVPRAVMARLRMDVGDLVALRDSLTSVIAAATTAGPPPAEQSQT
ncbi:DNA-binding transcriptional regulator, MarR family [Quadrisphaera granulorum]|uniref:DNA-binding MarR family transcriptional regulator n=1 Tax=Quadrisphaera granulorum TaxID=317664 RepID=A0A316AJW9_9ACTN|nr:MarR family transcriptional regulator [Quadrisphaera granulorum]PWJ50267.1 DNA-binding MarR family transcriptional regulator [Quadrisphaera granulorum]SZE98033.1 DNA-binding transcriptional regulator, MarR family [Quadrisphaera granulorum]